MLRVDVTRMYIGRSINSRAGAFQDHELARESSRLRVELWNSISFPLAIFRLRDLDPRTRSTRTRGYKKKETNLNVSWLKGASHTNGRSTGFLLYTGWNSDGAIV